MPTNTYHILNSHNFDKKKRNYYTPFSVILQYLTILLCNSSSENE